MARGSLGGQGQSGWPGAVWVVRGSLGGEGQSNVLVLFCESLSSIVSQSSQQLSVASFFISAACFLSLLLW